MAEKVLIVEDETSLQDTLAYNLKKQGYETRIASQGLEAIESARQFKPDIILLDIMLPGMDGFEVCRVLRQEISTPILMLTARDDEIDRVVGLEVGADDYITKPFSMRELMARVKAMLRRVRMIRAEAQEPAGQLTPTPKRIFGNLAIDETRHEVVLNEKILSLKPKEYDLLDFLTNHPRQVLSRDFLLERVWGWDFTGESRTVDVHIRWLREKIEPDPATPVRIVTVRSAGYRFEG